MTFSITLPKWYDLHTHLRQDALLSATIADHLKAHCAGVLAMPNTRPPVGKVLESDPLPHWSIEGYRKQIEQAGGAAFDHAIVPLYLTQDTTPEMIAEGAKSGVLKACKYYPPHGTTNADYGRPLQHFIDNGVFAAMAEHNVVLCIHGEEAGLNPETYFARDNNAETLFYTQTLPKLRDAHPELRMVCEHITTEAAVHFVQKSDMHVAATVTPQHLLYTVGHLLQGLKYHLYCLPVLKFEQDRDAIRAAVTADDNQKFFAGSDSAPHTHKATPCGCAAGCYTAPINPQLYAMAFEAAGMDLSEQRAQQIFKQFLCENGPAFYGLPIPKETFTLEKRPQDLQATITADGELVTLPIGLNPDHAKSGTQIDWAISP